MDKFEHDLIVREKSKWMRLSNKKYYGNNLLKALNDLGKQGWEAVAMGDLGGDYRAEIILKRRVT